MAAIKRPPPLRVWGGVEEAATAVDRLAAPHRHRSLGPVRPTSLQRPLRLAPPDGPCFSAARRWTGRLCGRRSTALHAKSNLTLGLTPPAAAGAARRPRLAAMAASGRALRRSDGTARPWAAGRGKREGAASPPKSCPALQALSGPSSRRARPDAASAMTTMCVSNCLRSCPGDWQG